MLEKQNTIVLQKRDFGDGGGVATLFWRIAKYCNTHDIDCYIFAGKIKDEDARFYEETSVKCINVGVIEGIEYRKRLKEFVYGLDGRVTVLSTEFKDYVIFHDMCIGRKEIRNILYSVHENTFNKLNASSFRKWQDQLIYKHIVKKCLESGDLFFCDRYYADFSLDYYSVNCEDRNKFILTLPIEIDKQGSIDWGKKQKEISKERILISVARADFPFKEYLLGLVDDYIELLEKYEDIKLLIISYGDQFDKLKRYVEDANKKYNCNILLINGVDYNDLANYYKKAYLNIGMGTTVLEAANFALPSILVKSYSREVLSFGDFSSNPLYISAPEANVNALVYIKNILDMNLETYKNLCYTTKNILREYYSIESFVNKILQEKHNSKRFLGFIDKVYWNSKEVFKRRHFMFK